MLKITIIYNKGSLIFNTFIMKRIPPYTVKEILEIKRKRDINIKYCILKKEYDISYYDIKKIERMFNGCEFEDDVEKRIDEVIEHNRLNEYRIKNYRIAYLKYKDYYQAYAKWNYAKNNGKDIPECPLRRKK